MRNGMIKFFLPVALLAGCASAKHNTDSKSAAPAAPAAHMAPAAPAKPLPPSATVATCEKKNDKRVLELVSTNPGCRLDYQKFGKTHNAASSSKGEDHCVAAMKKIKGHLEAAGFRCQS